MWHHSEIGLWSRAVDWNNHLPQMGFAIPRTSAGLLLELTIGFARWLQAGMTSHQTQSQSLLATAVISLHLIQMTWIPMAMHADILHS